MTQLLRVSGIAVPVLEGSASHKRMSIGDVERAEDGTKLISRRAIKETFKLKVAHRTPSEGIAWEKLFTGEGHTWSFDASLYSSKGLGPSASTAASVDASNVKFGANSCRLGSGTGTISFPALSASPPKWSVMVWRKTAGGSYDHYIVTSTSKSAGHAYKNGADAADATAWLSVSGLGVVKLDADAALNTYYDDLVVLPFDVPSSWPADVFAYGSAFSQLAKLSVDGDLVNGNVGTMTVCGEVNGVDVLSGWMGGVFYQAVRVLDVTLEEG